MKQESLTIGEILDLCVVNGIKSNLPYSQLEAEAVWRNVDISEVIRAYLVSLLRASSLSDHLQVSP